jgi:hypothetical protein
LLPFLKFVVLRSQKFAPYLIVTGGREFQWGGTDNPAKGYSAVGSWLAGGGAGAHIGVGAHLAIKLQILALYCWYDETIVRYSGGDTEKLDGELLFPIVQIGLAFTF